MVAAVPRALEEAHIREDLDVFDFSLSDAEMRQISALRRRNIRIADPPERAPKWDVEKGRIAERWSAKYLEVTTFPSRYFLSPFPGMK